MEKDYCNKCGECCRSILVNFEKQILYREGIQELSEEFASYLEPVGKYNQATICKCKFLENNLCTNTQKPQECKDFPSSPFAVIPEDCGYSGVIFLKLENIKRQIRKLKEEIFHYEALMQTITNKFEYNQLKKIVETHKLKIKKYRDYGSEDW